jgi:SAM-dependent methyltransferase
MPWKRDARKSLATGGFPPSGDCPALAAGASSALPATVRGGHRRDSNKHQEAAMGTAPLQGDLWGARANDWTQLQEPAFRPLYEAAFRAAGVKAGTRLLDIGCGAGLALTVAAELGAQASGLDAAAELIAIARQRLPLADIRVGELEDLPFDAARFDVASGFNAFQYAADRVHALAEARRVAGGGRVIAAVWGDPARCEMGEYINALGRLMPPPPAGAPGPWALSGPGDLERLLEQAGLEPQGGAAVEVVFRFADDAVAVRGLLASGPAVRAARHSGEEATAQAIAAAIAPFRRSDGAYALSNEFRFVVASA